MNKQKFVYVGADKCGCVVAIHTFKDPYNKPDPTQWREGLAESLSEWIMDGYTVHFVTSDEGHRLINLDCPHDNTEPETNEAIADAYTEYLDALRFSDASVLELQRQRDLVFEESAQ